jgi:hypothetical protein
MPFQSTERIFTQELKALIPILGKEKALRISRAYLLGDEETRERIFEMMDAVKAAAFTDKDLRETVLMEPPSRQEAMNGDIEIGTVLYGKKRLYPFRIDKEMLLAHFGVFGSSGYGKTNLSYLLAEQLSERDVPVVIFDFSKRNYRDLLNTELRDVIKIYTVGRGVSPLKFNPLRPPPGIQLSQWIKEFSVIFDHAYWLLGGGRHIILKGMDGVYAERNSPRMLDLKKWLYEYSESTSSAREKNWMATASRPLESLCFKEVGEVFDCDEGMLPSDYLKPGQITILELDGLTDNDKTFFIEITLQWLRDWMLIHGQREKLQGVIILEEAHHILNRDKANKMGSETVIDLVFREIRELGLGVLYVDQHPSLVSYPALGNTSTQIYMNLALDTKHSSDILDASNMLGLNYDEQGNYLRRLPVGHGFVLCRMSKFPESFLIEFPHIKIKKGSISDGDVAEHMGLNYIEEEVTPAHSGSGMSSGQSSVAGDSVGKRVTVEGKQVHLTESEKVAAVPKSSSVSFPVPPSKEVTPAYKPDKVSLDDIDDNGWKIIKVLGDGRGAFTSQIYKTLGMSGTVFAKVSKQLDDMGIVGFSKAKLGKNWLNYYFLTDKGEQLFSKMFGELKGTTNLDLEGVYDMFAAAGWKHDRNGFELTIHADDRDMMVMLVDAPDKAKIFSDLSRTRYFVCANDRLKNVVSQQAAKYARFAKTGYVLFISTTKTFEEKGEFEKIEIV